MTGIPLFERIAFIGIGLIGSSLARVIRRDGLAGHVVACARSRATLKTVSDLALADSVTDNPAEAAEGADLVVLCQKLEAAKITAETHNVKGRISKFFSAGSQPPAEAKELELFIED